MRNIKSSDPVRLSKSPLFILFKTVILLTMIIITVIAVVNTAEQSLTTEECMYIGQGVVRVQDGKVRVNFTKEPTCIIHTTNSNELSKCIKSSNMKDLSVPFSLRKKAKSLVGKEVVVTIHARIFRTLGGIYKGGVEMQDLWELEK